MWPCVLSDSEARFLLRYSWGLVWTKQVAWCRQLTLETFIPHKTAMHHCLILMQLVMCITSSVRKLKWWYGFAEPWRSAFDRVRAPPGSTARPPPQGIHHMILYHVWHIAVNICCPRQSSLVLSRICKYMKALRDVNHHWSEQWCVIKCHDLICWKEFHWLSCWLCSSLTPANLSVWYTALVIRVRRLAQTFDWVLIDLLVLASFGILLNLESFQRSGHNRLSAHHLLHRVVYLWCIHMQRMAEHIPNI